MALPTTLYKVFLILWKCHIIEGSMNKQIRICSMIKASKEEGVNGEGSYIKVYNLWVSG
jgi:hypothetical protein